jgi:probable F420-dependent oxidoreductase
MPAGDAVVQLALLAARTERVTVGTSALLLPLYPPAIVARQFADMDRYTEGRVVLGVGVGGEYPAEFGACQIPVNERGRRADEAIPLIRRLWTGEEVTHRGRFYPMEKVRLNPPPLRPDGPPVVIAGRQPAAMRRAALLGDGWMPYLYSPRRYAESVETIRRLAAEAGRDLAGFQWMAHVFICVREDGEEAREEVARMLGGTYNQDFRPMVDRVAAAGTPDEVARRIQEFVDAGARHFIFVTSIGGDIPSEARPIVDEIVPRLKTGE